MADHDEWGHAVAAMTEMQRTATEIDVRRTEGLAGDIDDDI